MSEKNEIFVLPFDHRGSFVEEMFGILGQPTAEEVERVKLFKGIIYDGFRLAMERGTVPKEEGAILVDEEFGDAILQDARRRGYRICLCAEKSGQKEFELEFGDDFQAHIDKYKPEFVKALVRYNPDDDPELNERQAEKLKQLSDFCRGAGYKLMLEPLVPPTEKQLEMVGGDREAYDREMRPQLMELMIEELQDGGVEPDIWKIEGLEDEEDYRILVEQARSDQHPGSIIILGRHASDEQVARWLEIGARVEGVIGFAVGRTIFWDALLAYKAGEITAEEAEQKIADRFAYFYRIFKGERA